MRARRVRAGPVVRHGNGIESREGDEDPEARAGGGGCPRNPRGTCPLVLTQFRPPAHVTPGHPAQLEES